MISKFVILPLVLVCGVLLSACASTSGRWEAVKPWEKGLLAKPDMALDANHIDEAYDDHIYFSKEASSGGRSFGGGGCGCN